MNILNDRLAGTVINKVIDGVVMEPMELLVVDVPEEYVLIYEDM